MASRSYPTWCVVVVSLGITLLGLLNLMDRAVQPPPADDGVRWRATPQGLMAESVRAGSSAERAGVIRGDVLRAILVETNPQDPPEPLAVTKEWHIQYYLDEYVHVGGNATYLVERYNPRGLSLGLWQAELRQLDPQPSRFWFEVYAAFVGALYLLIGLVVFTKHEHVSQALHFFAICALSFIYLVWNTSGALTTFDTFILWADRVSLIVLCPTFLHFCATFPLRSAWLERRRRLIWLMYGPAVVLALFETLHLFLGRYSAWLLDLRPTLDQLTLIHFAVAFAAALSVVTVTFFQTETPLLKQQMKWMVVGLTLGIVPWLAFYGAPVVAGVEPTPVMEALALGPTVFIPLAFGYAIVRYRLMDVDVIVRRSLTYALATFGVVMIFMLGVVKMADWIRETYPAVPPVTTTFLQVVVLSGGAMLYAPFKNWLQERIDRIFYGARYDTRLGLADFGRAMATTTALPELLSAIARKLSDAVSVTDLAIFLPDTTTPPEDAARGTPHLRPVFASGLTGPVMPSHIEQNILQAGPRGYLVDEAGLAEGDLAYYFPCVARGRLVAVIALGKTVERTLLTSEDTELLRGLAPYMAVAIENSLFYERERARVEELARLKEFNENIIESINVGIVVIDCRGQLTTWNSTFEKLFALPPPPPEGWALETLFDPDLLCMMRGVIGGNAGWQITDTRTIYRCRTQGRDGQSLVLNITLLPLQTRALTDGGALICFEDMTIRVRLEEQLREADKLSSIGLLAAGVAHEVNTPLAGISSYTQMLLAECSDHDPRRSILEKIRRQTLRASDIVNNLLNFSRTGNSTFAPVDLATILDDTIQLLETHLRGTAIEIHKDYGGKLPPVWGHASKLQQVFMNLMLNARDAMPHGGVLTITTAVHGNAVTIAVSDTGIGIPAEIIHRIYDPFFTTKEVGHGTGLGLAVSYGIVQEHGGHVFVESAPGQGTTFRVKLPVASTQVAPPGAPAPFVAAPEADTVAARVPAGVTSLPR
ncbi:PAS-domain containing protein [Chloracidobacterium sp. MS 40/45]|uniref:ATP-binding protein n=1 Tax=Chloracidobacterium aggregatum TaxID=2851959 RepID=UPI001B8B5764|nr:ATP-binding protein [Chloracidobacterium aggregatum]QUV98999.1 PAS-domain containing protein [Chloracidobacterium sp. MS 40/45]